MTPAEFWSRVAIGDPDACWPWLRRDGRVASGAGVFVENGQRVLPHRRALQLSTGRDEPLLNGCHHCDNPPCCNPAHLYWGTQAQNIADAVARRRLFVFTQPSAWKLLAAEGGRQGDRTHKRGRLQVSDIDAMAIVAAVRAGELQADVAARYGTTQSNVSKIVRGTRLVLTTEDAK